MPAPHLSLGSPVSPLPSRPESFGPLSQYHRKPIRKESIVSPLGTEWPDSPTLGYLSPVSIVSPHSSFQQKPLHHDRTPTAAKPRVAFDSPASIPEIAQEVAVAAAATAGEPSTIPLARGNMLHLQDHMPFKPAITPFPRKPLVEQVDQPTQASVEENVPSRPITMYLADHHPHLIAPPPRPPIARPKYQNLEGRLEEIGQARMQDIEMGEVESRARRPIDAEKGAGDGRTKAEIKRRRRNCLIGWVFAFALVVLIVVFAVLVVQANKPGGVAG